MPSRPLKSNGTESVRNDPPPYSGPSTYSILAGPSTPVDIEERLLIKRTPEYCSLLKRLRVSMFINAFLLMLLVLAVGFAFYTRFENHRLQDQIDARHTNVTNGGVAVHSPDSLKARGMCGRMCFTGYSETELILEAALMQQRYEYKDKVWNMACSDTGAFKYPEDVEAEFSYVVLRS
jgi:hypothetical protein